ncbi:hypothetical protein [Streptomyces sp. NPDC059063]|uniref:hypothetical protein n=1 Tax=Streptomyces sp. NPDC059063 TaxID=3346712 RepID=UPI0036C4225D
MTNTVSPQEQDDTAATWNTLRKVECPFQLYGIDENGFFRPAGDRKQLTGEPLTITELWVHGSLRYGKDDNGREVYLGGLATKFWTAPGVPAGMPAAAADNAPAEDVAAAEDAAVTHDVTAQGSAPRDAAHPHVVAARQALDGLAAATLTDHHDFIEPDEDERRVSGYVIDLRGHGYVAVYWLEEGRPVRRSDRFDGSALDYLANRLTSRGWRTLKLLRSSRCVIAYPPQADAQAAAVFVKGDAIVCTDGVRRTVDGMVPSVPGEPERVIVEGGGTWSADNCRRANLPDVLAAHERANAAAARVAENPAPSNRQWRAALDELGRELEYLKATDSVYRAVAEEGRARAAATAVHADARNFEPLHRLDGTLAGWTFATGYGARDVYGVVTTDAQVAPVGLYEYRITAVRAFLQAEQEADGAV